MREREGICEGEKEYPRERKNIQGRERIFEGEKEYQRERKIFKSNRGTESCMDDEMKRQESSSRESNLEIRKNRGVKERELKERT